MLTYTLQYSDALRSKQLRKRQKLLLSTLSANLGRAYCLSSLVSMITSFTLCYEIEHIFEEK